MSNAQSFLSFSRLTSEIELAKALHARTGRDLFAGLTNREDRKAAARIQIIVNHLQSDFAAAFQDVYGEALPEVKRLEKAQPTRKGKEHENV